MAKTSSPSANIALESLAGHHIRRLQQIAVAIFLQENQSHGLTPVQYAALQAVRNKPGMDQRSLARTIGFDTSTIAGVVDRLEARGLMRRNASQTDRRVRLLDVTAEGVALLDVALPAVLRTQERILEPLAPKERAEFLRILRQLVQSNNELSRAPSGN
ncbi:MAG: MarR family winged helix-turn-helix transcriptional regulator [Thiomonas sp.]